MHVNVISVSGKHYAVYVTRSAYYGLSKFLSWADHI